MKTVNIFRTGFFTYFRSLFYGAPAAKANAYAYDMLVGILSAFFLETLLGGFDQILTVNFLPVQTVCMLMWICFAYIAYIDRRRPALLTVVPVKWQFKTLYFICSCLLMTVVTGIFLMLFFAVIFGLIFLLIALASNDFGIFSQLFSEFAGSWVSAETAGQAGFLYAAIIIGAFGAVLNVNLIKRRYLRNIFSFVAPLGIFLPLAALDLITQYFAGVPDEGEVFYNLSMLPLSWLWISLVFAAGVAVAGVAIFRTAKHFRPDKNVG